MHELALQGNSSRVQNLQGVLEKLVHLGKLSGNAEVNGAVANLDDESALDLGVDL